PCSEESRAFAVVAVPGVPLRAPLLQGGRLLPGLAGLGEKGAPPLRLRARRLRGLGRRPRGGGLLLLGPRRPLRRRVFEEVVPGEERDLAARGPVEVGQRLVRRIGTDAVEDVV